MQTEQIITGMIIGIIRLFKDTIKTNAKKAMSKKFLPALCLLYFFNSYSLPIVLHTLEGKLIPLVTLQGKYIFINYWASWCENCLAEIVELNCFVKSNQSKVTMFAVNYDMVYNNAQIALAKKYQIDYLSIVDPADELKLGEIQAVPATFIVNKEGELLKKLFGAQKCVDLKKLVEQQIDL